MRRVRFKTNIFDIGAWVNCDHISVLDSEVVSDNTVDASATVIKLLISEDDKHGILSLLATNEHGVTTEELQRVHSSL